LGNDVQMLKKSSHAISNKPATAGNNIQPQQTLPITERPRRQPDPAAPRQFKENQMAPATPPKDDRAGSDHQRGPNPAPGATLTPGTVQSRPMRIETSAPRTTTRAPHGLSAAKNPPQTPTARSPPRPRTNKAPQTCRRQAPESAKEPGRIDTDVDVFTGQESQRPCVSGDVDVRRVPLHWRWRYQSCRQ
jgi:hypothetical protein